MKKSNLFSVIIFAMVLCISMASCKKCKKENPRARIRNNGTMVASVQIKTSAGNTENINNVDPGTVSEYRSYAPGQITFTITVEKTPIVEVVNMGTCFEYDITINANNQIVTTPTDRND